MGARAKPAVPVLIKRIGDDVWKESHSGLAIDADPRAGGKGAALDALERLAPDKVIDALFAARKSKNDSVRAWATAELTRRSTKKPTPPDKGDEPGAEVDDAVVKALIEDLGDKDGQVRRKAAEGLGKMGARAKPAVPVLIKRIGDDVWKESHSGLAVDADPLAGGKGAALEALEKLAPGKVTDALLAARKSKNDRVRAWAITELTRRSEKK
jgi:HEAT repeat protein